MPGTTQTIIDAASNLAWLLAIPALAALAFLLVRSKGRRIKGWVGEKAVRSLLSANGVDHLHDVYLPSRNGVTQVDHIAYVGGSILVVETKNYEGAIYPQHGNIDWTQSLARGRVTNRFQSPILQNLGHMKAVRALVGGSVAVEGLVVFAGGASFPKGMPDGVVRVTDLPREIRRIATLRTATPETLAAWEKLKAAHAATDRAGSRATHMETVARAKGRSAARKAA